MTFMFSLICVHLENHAEGVLLRISLASQNVPSNNWLEKTTDNSPGPNGFIGVVGVDGFWVRLDVGASISVGKIIIAVVVPEPFKDQLVDFELRVGKQETYFKTFPEKSSTLSAIRSSQYDYQEFSRFNILN